MNMKRFFAALCFTLMVATIGSIFSSCDEDDEITTTLVLEIDSAAGEYFNISTAGSMPGMWVTEEEKNNWKVWSQKKIQGFTFEEGYYAKVMVQKKTQTPNPDMLGGDSSSTKYILLKILEKKESASVRN